MKCPKCDHVFKVVQFVKGGKARWKGMTKKQRNQAASNAALARWAKRPKKQPIASATEPINSASV